MQGRKSPSEKKINDGRKPKQQDKWGIPGCIKNIAGQQQVDLFYFPGKGKIMQDENDYKKSDESV